jgi:thiamine pyrophosphokinase
MRCIIFANGIYNHKKDIFSILSKSLIIAADAGLYHCEKIGIIPDVIIGDFDSISKDFLYYYKDKNVKIIEYPPEKDKTDLELAFLYAAQKKVNEIIVIGALGKRWDMTFANILIPFLPELKNISIRFIDDKTEITVLFGNNKKKFSGKKGDIFSIIPISSEALGVTLSGFKYPLKNANIKIGATIGISNIFLEEKAEVSIKKGRLLCIHERGN